MDRMIIIFRLFKAHNFPSETLTHLKPKASEKNLGARIYLLKLQPLSALWVSFPVAPLRFSPQNFATFSSLQPLTLPR